MKTRLLLTSIILCSLSLAGCGSQESAELAQTKKDQAAMKADRDALKAENEQLKSKIATMQAESAKPAQASQTAPSNTTTATPPSTDTGATATVGGAGFTDINGVDGANVIAKLRELGALEPDAKFNPDQPIKRREFVRWLVKTTNALVTQDNYKIKLTRTGKATFPDVPPSDPDFPYIQTLCDIGLSVGYDDKTFKPDQVLTREEMFALKSIFDLALSKSDFEIKTDFITGHALDGQFKDIGQVAPRLRKQVGFQFEYGNWNNNFSRVYGTTKYFKPKEPVTRSQAVGCMSSLGSCGYGVTGWAPRWDVPVDKK